MSAAALLYASDPLLADALAEAAEKYLALGRLLEVNLVTEREVAALERFIAAVDEARHVESSG